MNVVAKALELYTPDWIKRKAIRELFAATAEAFACPVPPMQHFSYRMLLDCYARFTNECAQVRSTPEDREALRERLYRGGYRLGEKYGKSMGLATTGDVMAAARLLYRILDIDLHGTADGQVTITRCFFSCLYSSEVCRVMSSMDRGLLAGLAGGRVESRYSVSRYGVSTRRVESTRGDLEFTARITEGASSCRAVFSPPKEML